MDRYYGFDLGDAESAVTYLKKDEKGEPNVVPVREAGSFITAYAASRAVFSQIPPVHAMSKASQAAFWASCICPAA